MKGHDWGVGSAPGIICGVLVVAFGSLLLVAFSEGPAFPSYGSTGSQGEDTESVEKILAAGVPRSAAPAQEDPVTELADQLAQAEPATPSATQVAAQQTEQYILRSYLEQRPTFGNGSEGQVRSASHQRKGGIMVRPDTTQEHIWLSRGAAMGQTTAQKGLGVYYANGSGEGSTYVQGYMWLKVAARNGDKEAAAVLRELSKKMTEKERAEGERLAEEQQQP